MSENEASCAHNNVSYNPIPHENGTWSNRWVCDSGCGMNFWPAPAAPQSDQPRRCLFHKIPVINQECPVCVLEDDLKESRAEFAVLSRACGNWREWPNQPTTDRPTNNQPTN